MVPMPCKQKYAQPNSTAKHGFPDVLQTYLVVNGSSLLLDVFFLLSSLAFSGCNRLHLDVIIVAFTINSILPVARIIHMYLSSPFVCYLIEDLSLTS